MNPSLIKHLRTLLRAGPRPRSNLSLAVSAAILVIALPGVALASADSELEFNRAVAAYGEGDLDRAREGFEQVLQADPGDASALHYLALVAIKRGDVGTAVAHLERLVGEHPELVPPRVDLAAQYLKMGRNEEALEQLDEALKLEPDYAPALLYQGIALYREQIFDEALVSLQRAAELDPRLSPEAHYYQGLSNAYLGNAAASAAAFDTAASGSPQSPLGRSATKLYGQAARSARPWSLAATVGLEYDNNLRLSSQNDLGLSIIPGTSTGKTKSGAGVVGLQGQVEAYSNESFSWRVGYDGYLQAYWDNDEDTLTPGQNFKATDLSQQTHVAWSNTSYQTEFATFALRYDYSYTWINLKDKFRSIQRVAPTAYVPISEWGLFLGFYQFLYYDYKINISNPAAFDRSGPQHSAGAQQFVFLPDPLNYMVVGLLYTHFDSDGTEFRNNGVEASLGGELDLPWEVSLGVLYRYSHRKYSEFSAVTVFPTPPTKRKDDEHEISFSLDRTFAGRYNLSVAGSYAHNASNIDNFDINRFIIGTYLRYAF